MNANHPPKLSKLIESIKKRTTNELDKLVLEAIGEKYENQKIIFDIGILCAENSLLNEALIIFDNLSAIDGNNINYLYNLGLIHSISGKHQFAIDVFTKILQKNPADNETLINRSSSFIEIKEYKKAEEDIEIALRINPECAEALINKGIILNRKKQFDDAATFFDSAIKLSPNNYEAYSNKSIAILNLGKYIEAINLCDKAISLNNNYAEAYYNKAYALTFLKEYLEANDCLGEAIRIKPDFTEAYINKGFVLLKLQKYHEAIEYLEKATNKISDNADLYLNKAVCYQQLKQFKESLSEYDNALALNPISSEYLLNKANLLFEMKQYEDAIKNYEIALEIDSTTSWLFGNLVHAKMQICDWKNYKENIQKLMDQIEKNKKVCQPFVLLPLLDLPEIHRKVAEIYAENEYPQNKYTANIKFENKNNKVKIGYYSSDFKDHAVSILMVRIFELHDREKFEIHGFSYGINDDSKINKRLKKAFDYYHNVINLSEAEIATLSREYKIDIAVDLGGFTLDNRFGIFSYRAAPIQVEYLGYLGTTGTKYIDYLISDEIIIPKNLQKNYSEKIAYIPYYQANDSIEAYTLDNYNIKVNRKEYFIFCNFNNNYKITPDMFSLWMNILKKCDNSKLYLYAESKSAKTNLLKEAEIRNIDASRLIFGERLPYDAYLNRYLECDLFLDTFPYNAGTTASDALRAGLPILTLEGKSFASRMASSILHSIGTPELIAKTPEEYEETAVALVNQKKLYQSIKNKIMKNKKEQPLFNSKLFVNNLEKCYLNLIRNRN